MKSVKQRRQKIGDHYNALGYGRGTNKRNVYLIDGKAYAYHPEYSSETMYNLTGEMKGYVRVNWWESIGVFWQCHESEHKPFK